MSIPLTFKPSEDGIRNQAFMPFHWLEGHYFTRFGFYFLSDQQRALWKTPKPDHDLQRVLCPPNFNINPNKRRYCEPLVANNTALLK